MAAGSFYTFIHRLHICAFISGFVVITVFDFVVVKVVVISLVVSTDIIIFFHIAYYHISSISSLSSPSK